MKIKVVFFIFSFLYVSVANVSAQKNKSAQVASPAEPEQEELSYDWTEGEEEIDNFDFLYFGNEKLKYDANLVESLMEEAKKHIGARYRLGSKGPKAFDCSGFTSYVYKQQGNKNIGCSSRDQYARNTPITRSELQPGDLVFFTSPGSRRGVGHVGIVIDFDPISENFTFIHASSSGGVKINKSTDGYYTRRYVGARRVE